MKFGFFPGRAVKESAVHGETNNGTPELVFLMRMKLEDGTTQEAPTRLYFSAEAAPFSFARLRELGWEGNDLTNLNGIDKNEVQTRLWQDTYEGKPQIKCEIGSGPGVVTQNPMSKEAFAAKVAALTGAQVAGGAQKGKASVPWDTTKPKTDDDIPF